MKSITCVYVIKNKENKKKYIGGTRNLKHRWHTHKSFLNSNKHVNTPLQKDWNTFGESNFYVEIIEETDLDNLLDREKYHINIMKPEYNIIYSSPYTNKKIRSREHREAIGLANSKRTKEQREQMAKKSAKTYEFLSPAKEVIKVTNLKRFCIKNNLDISNMVKVYNGKRNTHKGWKRLA